MLFLQRQPAPPLQASISSIWFCRAAYGSPALQRVLPGTGPQLILNLKEDQTRVYEPHDAGLTCITLPGSTLTGLSTRSQIIDTAEQEFVAGVRFLPGGTLPFFRVPAFALSNRDVPLECLWDRAAVERLRDQLLAAPSAHGVLDVLEASFLAIWNQRAIHPATNFALQTFGADPSLTRIDAVADAAGLSPKRFIERFKAEVGLTPKRYCRLLRFQAAVRRAHRREVDWTRLAHDCGYFDQAHFNHEFREFSGLTPSAYVAGATAFQNHVNFVQSPETPVR